MTTQGIFWLAYLAFLACIGAWLFDARDIAYAIVPASIMLAAAIAMGRRPDRRRNRAGLARDYNGTI